MPLALVAGLVAISAVFTGCATITRGTTEQLTILSDPSGASVRLSNGFTGVTPATFTIPRKGEVVVTVMKEGYKSIDVQVFAKVSNAGTAGFLGNALIGGVIGGGVDIATGAMLSHTPNPVHVTLVAAAPPAAPVVAPVSTPAAAVVATPPSAPPTPPATLPTPQPVIVAAAEPATPAAAASAPVAATTPDPTPPASAPAAASSPAGPAAPATAGGEHSMDSVAPAAKPAESTPSASAAKPSPDTEHYTPRST